MNSPSSPSTAASDTASSRDASSDPLDLLEELGTLYDDAFSALQQGEIDRISNLLDAADAVLDDLDGPLAKDLDLDRAAEAKRRAQASQGRLTAGIVQTSDAVRSELQKVRRSRKGIRGYGKKGDQTPGTRISSQA